MTQKTNTELITATTQLISLAQLKGFQSEKDVKAFMLEPWMPIQDIFANTVCVAVQWWLRTQHKIDVWVEPSLFGKYRGYVIRDGNDELQDTSLLNNLNIEDQYEIHFIRAIEYALNSLPPAAQEHH